MCKKDAMLSRQHGHTGGFEHLVESIKSESVYRAKGGCSTVLSECTFR